MALRESKKATAGPRQIFERPCGTWPCAGDYEHGALI